VDPHWPRTADELAAAQRRIAAQQPPAWSIPDRPLLVAGCFVCFPRWYTGTGHEGDPAWAAAALFEGRRRVDAAVRVGEAGSEYQAGLLALREGPLLETAVRGLARRPDVLLVNATGRDHPRQAGLALHLGAVLDLPTIGVTHRPLIATGDEPADEAGASSPLWYGDAEVARWLRTRSGARPIVVHAGWRTDTATAVAVVSAYRSPRRTPQPLREARRLARQARAVSPAT
jgi:deoxyribonuclease V